MGFRPLTWVLLTAALVVGAAEAAPELGYVDRGNLRFRGAALDEKAELSGPGLIETGAVAARIALEIGGHLTLEPGTQIRLVVGEDGTKMVTVIRGKVTIETVGGQQLTAGRNRVFRLDRATVRAGGKDEPDYGDDR